MSSPAHAQAAPRLHMHDLSLSSSATECISQTLPDAPQSGAAPQAHHPYTVDKNGHGPAWANSLFEDNAEHGFGMYLGQEAIRNRLVEEVAAVKRLPTRLPTDVKGCLRQNISLLWKTAKRIPGSNKEAC